MIHTLHICCKVMFTLAHVAYSYDAHHAALLLSLTLRLDMELSLLSTSHSVSTPESPPPPWPDIVSL